MYIEVNNKPLNIYSIAYFYKDEKDNKYRIVYKTTMGIIEVEEFDTSADRDSKYDELKSIEIPGGGGAQPTGTINITENGIYDVTNYASANVSVEPSYNVTTISEANKQITKISKQLDDYYKSVVDNYETLTTDSVSLYTPNTNYTKYALFVGTNGKSVLVWLDERDFIVLNLEYKAFKPYGTTANLGSSSNSFKNINFRYSEMSVNVDLSYQEFNSLEEGIIAIKDNATSYKNWTTNNFGLGFEIKEIYTNIKIENINDYPNIIIKRISSNETIEVISS